MNRWRPQHFFSQGRKQGVDPAVLANSAAVAAALHKASPQLPPLFSLRHLAHECNAEYGFLRAVISRSSQIEPYKFFQLKKKNVGHESDRLRTICVPHPSLLRAQRWIHTNILREVAPHSASYAYEPGSSTLKMAEMHTGCRWLIKLDVTSFFESILEPKVYKVFRGMGYQPLVAFELTRLCTRLRTAKNPPNRVQHRWTGIENYQSRVMGHLPQGAPTSPMLANLACHKLDTDLTALAAQSGLTYTRYADDLTFSTTMTEFSFVQAKALIESTYNVMTDQWFFPNRAKAKVLPPGARKVVLGLLVDGERPRLTREFRDRLRMHIHFVLHKDIGPVRHAAARGFDSVLGLQHHLFGLAAYAYSVDAEYGGTCLQLLRKAEWPVAVP